MILYQHPHSVCMYANIDTVLMKRIRGYTVLHCNKGCRYLNVNHALSVCISCMFYSAMCQPPPPIHHGRVMCSFNDSNLIATTCKYVCDEGYIVPNSYTKFITWKCNQDVTWNQTRTPKCISN